jgi:DNA-binding CsgD family transcriptional regulator
MREVVAVVGPRSLRAVGGLGELTNQLGVLGADLERALEEAGLPLYALDCGGAFRWVNAAMAELIGDVVGRKFKWVVAPEQVSRARHEFARKLIGAVRATDFELNLLDRSGQRVSVQVRSVALQGECGIVGVLGAAMPKLFASEGHIEVDEPCAAPRLTARQCEVLRLLGEALGTSGIAVRLGVSEETVRNHIRAIFRELGAHSRLEAVVAAHRLGLLR